MNKVFEALGGDHHWCQSQFSFVLIRCRLLTSHCSWIVIRGNNIISSTIDLLRQTNLIPIKDRQHPYHGITFVNFIRRPVHYKIWTFAIRIDIGDWMAMTNGSVHHQMLIRGPLKDKRRLGTSSDDFQQREQGELIGRLMGTHRIRTKKFRKTIGGLRWQSMENRRFHQKKKKSKRIKNLIQRIEYLRILKSLITCETNPWCRRRPIHVRSM